MVTTTSAVNQNCVHCGIKSYIQLDGIWQHPCCRYWKQQDPLAETCLACSEAAHGRKVNKWQKRRP